jgi:hypothetical protein
LRYGREKKRSNVTYSSYEVNATKVSKQEVVEKLQENS